MVCGINLCYILVPINIKMNKLISTPNKSWSKDWECLFSHVPASTPNKMQVEVTNNNLIFYFIVNTRYIHWLWTYLGSHLSQYKLARNLVKLPGQLREETSPHNIGRRQVNTQNPFHTNWQLIMFSVKEMEVHKVRNQTFLLFFQLILKTGYWESVVFFFTIFILLGARRTVKPNRINNWMIEIRWKKFYWIDPNLSKFSCRVSWPYRQEFSELPEYCFGNLPDLHPECKVAFRYSAIISSSRPNFCSLKKNPSTVSFQEPSAATKQLQLFSLSSTNSIWSIVVYSSTLP